MRNTWHLQYGNSLFASSGSAPHATMMNRGNNRLASAAPTWNGQKMVATTHGKPKPAGAPHTLLFWLYHNACDMPTCDPAATHACQHEGLATNVSPQRRHCCANNLNVQPLRVVKQQSSQATHYHWLVPTQNKAFRCRKQHSGAGPAYHKNITWLQFRKSLPAKYAQLHSKKCSLLGSLMPSSAHL